MRRDNTHDSVIVHYATESDNAGEFPVSDVIMENFILLKLELEVEAESLPLVMWQKLKSTVISSQL